MEVRFRSVMLLLSCSLHQSLLGILASMPQTDAKKCEHKLSSKDEPVKKVQMIRRIPARCSGWDEAWSWISKKDCHTKYILDYVELPSALQGDDKDCKEELSVPTPSSQFDITDEKFLAITFGSATLALLIIVVIIVVSVMRRRNHRSTCCGAGPSYTSANVVGRENPNVIRNCNLYESNKPTGDHIYEEVFDKTKIDIDDKEPFDMDMYKTVPNEDITSTTSNGVHQRRPVTPTAPLEEEVKNAAGKALPNEYSVWKERLVKSVEKQIDISDNIIECDTQARNAIATYSNQHIFDNILRSEGEYKNLDGECSNEGLVQDTLHCKGHNSLNVSELEQRLGELNATSNVYSEFESLLQGDVNEMVQSNTGKTVIAGIVQDGDKQIATDKITVNTLIGDNMFLNCVSKFPNDDAKTKVFIEDDTVHDKSLTSAGEIDNKDNVPDHCELVDDIVNEISTNPSTCNALYSETVDVKGRFSIEPIGPNDAVVLVSEQNKI